MIHGFAEWRNLKISRIECWGDTENRISSPWKEGTSGETRGQGSKKLSVRREFEVLVGWVAVAA